MCDICERYKADQLRYSPDQPREPNGEFGSGGGEQSKADKDALQSWGYDLPSENRLRGSEEFGKLLERNPDRYTGTACRGTRMSELDVARLRESRELELKVHSSFTAKENDDFAQDAAVMSPKERGVPVVLEFGIKDHADVGKEIFNHKGMEVIVKSGTTFKIGRISKMYFGSENGTGYRIFGSQK